MATRMIKNSSSLMVKLSIHQTPAPVSAPASPFLNRLSCWKSCSKFVRIKYNKYKISNTASPVDTARDGLDDFEHAAEYDDLA